MGGKDEEIWFNHYRWNLLSGTGIWSSTMEKRNQTVGGEAREAKEKEYEIG
ncbi:hypothetical protein [Peribacillus simplex]|uniref:hypothetical protein n=1 Tax=Peribacillus simplex TaxID=1478 RepID=UPI0024C18D10|nr:hypothetical protein [Peribacillus simplex]WHX89901.1 hypothetical protein QNH50_17920 [Peribacillus simplex]